MARILDQDELAALEQEKKTAQPGDLYHALHFVGDDFVKQEAEDILDGLLPPETMALVRAVFNLVTDWRVLSGGPI